MAPDAGLLSPQAVLLGLLWAGVVGLLLARLRRIRPELRLHRELALGCAVRLAAVALLGSSARLAALRGPDDPAYVDRIEGLSGTPLGSGGWSAILEGLHVPLLSFQEALVGGGEPAMRVSAIGVTLCALALLGAAVHDLAGPRAARIAVLLVACEPAGVFFSTGVGKEPLMVLGECLVVLGAVRFWVGGWRTGAWLMGLGIVVDLLTRPYAGVCLAGAAVLVVGHAALRAPGDRRRRGLAIGLAAVALVLGVGGAVAGSGPVLDRLDASQARNSTDGANLSLEPVDFSSPAGLAVGLPRRVRDLLLRPYPWQLATSRQRLGVIGTASALALLLALVAALLRGGRGVAADLVPVGYVLVLQVVAYALSTGNAGTGYRYRSHIVLLLIALVAVSAVRPATARRPRRPSA